MQRKINFEMSDFMEKTSNKVLNKYFTLTYKKVHYNLFHTLLFLFFILIFFSYSSKNEVNPILDTKSLKNFSNSWLLEYSNHKKTITLPFNDKEIVSNRILLQKKLPQINFDNNYLFFRSMQSYINIYVDDVLVYTYKPENSLFRKIPGSTWVLVPLKEEFSNKKLTIEKESKYKNFYGTMDEIYLGTKASIISYLIKNSFGGFITSFLMLIIGLLCIMISIFIKKMLSNRKIYFLGIFSILCSFWSLGELRILQLFIGNVNFVSHFAFLSLNMGHLAFLMFIYTFDFYSRDKIFKSIILASFTSFILINILHIFNIMDYFQSLVLTHLAILSSVVYICIKYGLFFFRKNIGKHINQLHFHMLIFFVIALSDLFKFYIFKTIKLGGGIRLGLCYFIFSMAILSFKQLSQAFSEKLELSLLKKIAFTDSLTKLNNRSAFEEKRKELELNEQIQEISIISADMNNLKLINDNLGHQEGDKALEEVSKLLYSYFKDYGCLYRLGGDEFIIICNNNLSLQVGNIFKELNNEIKYNIKLGRFKPYIAYGHVLFKSGDSFDEILLEADNQMYLCKERMKNRERLDYIFTN